MRSDGTRQVHDRELLELPDCSAPALPMIGKGRGTWVEFHGKNPGFLGTVAGCAPSPRTAGWQLV